MECYDHRVINGCHVYSYTMELPGGSESASSPAQIIRRERRGRCFGKQRRGVSRYAILKKLLLSLLFVLLSPLALLLDGAIVVARLASNGMYHLFREHRAAAGVLGTACCMTFLSSVLLFI